MHAFNAFVIVIDNIIIMLNVSEVYILKAELKLSSVGQWFFSFFLSNDSFCSNRSISLIFDEYLVSV